MRNAVPLIALAFATTSMPGCKFSLSLPLYALRDAIVSEISPLRAIALVPLHQRRRSKPNARQSISPQNDVARPRAPQVAWVQATQTSLPLFTLDTHPARTLDTCPVRAHQVTCAASLGALLPHVCGNKKPQPMLVGTCGCHFLISA